MRHSLTEHALGRSCASLATIKKFNNFNNIDDSKHNHNSFYLLNCDPSALAVNTGAVVARSRPCQKCRCGIFEAGVLFGFDSPLTVAATLGAGDALQRKKAPTKFFG